jgi:hypothetical protein
MGNSDLEAQIDEFPCIFPASKEIGVSEMSSLLTASSSGESANFRFLSRRRRILSHRHVPGDVVILRGDEIEGPGFPVPVLVRWL